MSDRAWRAAMLLFALLVFGLVAASKQAVWDECRSQHSLGYCWQTVVL